MKSSRWLNLATVGGLAEFPRRTWKAQDEGIGSAAAVPPVLRGARPPGPAVRLARPAGGGQIAPLHRRGDEPVQERVHGPRQARPQARRHQPEMPPHRRPRQRRPHRLPSHVLRDARQFLLRRLLQARGDPLGVGVHDAGDEAPARAAARQRLRGGRRGVRHLGEGSRPRPEDHLPLRPARQLLAGGRAEARPERPLRPVLGDLLRLRRGRRLPQARLPALVQLRPVLRGLEPRLPAVRPQGRRRARPAADAEH